MTPAQEYRNGVAVGRMYAKPLLWWWGFAVGQWLGTLEWLLDVRHG